MRKKDRRTADSCIVEYSQGLYNGGYRSFRFMLPLSSVTFVAESPVCAMFLSIQHLWQQAESKSAGFVNNPRNKA